MQLDEKQIAEMLSNPVYTGIGKYPRVIEDKLFILAAKRSIKSKGVEAYMADLLAALRKSFPTEEGEKNKPA